jgi:hypothetical protein
VQKVERRRARPELSAVGGCTLEQDEVVRADGVVAAVGYTPYDTRCTLESTICKRISLTPSVQEHTFQILNPHHYVQYTLQYIYCSVIKVKDSAKSTVLHYEIQIGTYDYPNTVSLLVASTHIHLFPKFWNTRFVSSSVHVSSSVYMVCTLHGQF